MCRSAVTAASPSGRADAAQARPLVPRLAVGNPRAARSAGRERTGLPQLEAVYRGNVDRVYGLMFSKVGNRADAEDLTAEGFLTALRPLHASATAGEVLAYLSATARTVLAEHWRRT